MKFGQIVHDLVQLDGSRISTREGNPGATISSNTDPSYETNKIDITKNLVTGTFNHVGIQAPEGTVVTINGSDFTIGANEVFELFDKDIPVQSLTFGSRNIKNLIIDYTFES